MRDGRHAADDNAFGRSAGSAALRGAALLAVAVILGIVLLQAADEGEPFDRVTAGQDDGDDGGNGETPATTAPAVTETTLASRPPAEVKVLAANGTGTKGLAGILKDRLAAAGYNALAPTDASKKPVPTSAVYFTPGYEPEARALAAGLGLPAGAVLAMPSPAPVANLQGANVLIVVGESEVAALSGTSTTRAGTTATTRR